MKRTIITFVLVILILPFSMEAKKKEKKEKKEDVPQLMNYPSAEWDEYRLHGGEVVIRGNVIVDDPAKLKNLNNEADVNIGDLHH